MSFPFYIARRYLFSKKSTSAINIISAISVLGVAVASMALVIVLSVFNGFHDLVSSFLTKLDPQIMVVPAKGKTAPADDPLLKQLKLMPEVAVATECVEDMALAEYHGKQSMVTIMGVEDNFDSLTHISEILYGDGEYELHAGNLQMGIPGIRLAVDMGLPAMWDGYLHIYAPRRDGQLDLSNPSDGFVVDSLFSAGVVFEVRQSKYDKDHIITSIDFARNLFGQQGMVSKLDFRLKPGADIDKVKAQMQKIVGAKYKVLDRMEQQADTFRIMQIEKFIAYIFLTFILGIACFNIIGSLSMLIVDKKNDVNTLRNLGASDKQISQIFLFEGRLISVMGAILGIAIGLLLCWLQQTVGIVALGSSSGNFVVDYYPVSVHYTDVLIIFLTVIFTGWLAVWYPVRYLSRRLL